MLIKDIDKKSEGKLSTSGGAPRKDMLKTRKGSIKMSTANCVLASATLLPEAAAFATSWKAPKLIKGPPHQWTFCTTRGHKHLVV